MNYKTTTQRNDETTFDKIYFIFLIFRVASQIFRSCVFCGHNIYTQPNIYLQDICFQKK